MKTRATILVLTLALSALAAAVASAQRRRPPRPRPVPPPYAAPAPASPAPAPTANPTPPAGSPGASAATAPSPYGESPAASAPAATPAPPSEPSPAPAPAERVSSEGSNVEALRTEYHQVLDDLFQARSRLQVVGSALYKTRLVVLVVNNTPESIVPTKLTVRLDGGSLYSTERPSRVESGEHAYDGFVTPGPHSLEVEVGAHARARAQYAFTQRNAFAFEAPDGHRTTITIVVNGEAPIAEDFPDDHEGQYEVRMRARVRAEPLPGAGHR